MENVDVPNVKMRKVIGGFEQKKRSEHLFLAIIFAFPILQFLVMYVGVNLNSILLAFKTYDQQTSSYYISGFGNFKEVFRIFSGDTFLLGTIKRGMTYYFFNTFLGMPINLAVAYLLYKKIRGAEFFRTVLFIPSLISSMAMVIMFQNFINEGITQLFIDWLDYGVYDVPRFFTDPKIAFPVMIFYNLWIGVGGGMIIYMSAMSRVPVSVIEYGRLEGISLPREFVSVIFPMIYPTVALFFVTGLPGLFMGSGPLYAFYGDKAQPEMQTLAYYLFTRIVGENASYQQYPFASAVGLTTTFVMAPIVFTARKVLNHFDPNVEY